MRNLFVVNGNTDDAYLVTEIACVPKLPKKMKNHFLVVACVVVMTCVLNLIPCSANISRPTVRRLVRRGGEIPNQVVSKQDEAEIGNLFMKSKTRTSFDTVVLVSATNLALNILRPDPDIAWQVRFVSQSTLRTFSLPNLVPDAYSTSHVGVDHHDSCDNSNKLAAITCCISTAFSSNRHNSNLRSLLLGSRIRVLVPVPNMPLRGMVLQQKATLL